MQPSHGPRACDVRHGTYSGRTAAPEQCCRARVTVCGMLHVASTAVIVLSHSSRQPLPATVQAPHRRKSKQQTLVHSRPEWLPQSGRLDSAVGCARHSSRHMNGYCIHTRIYSDHCLGPPLFVRTAAADSVSARRTLIVRRVGRHIRLPSNPAQAAVGLVNATPTSARGLDAPLPHLHRDWARPCPHLHRDWAATPSIVIRVEDRRTAPQAAVAAPRYAESQARSIEAEWPG